MFQTSDAIGALAVALAKAQAAMGGAKKDAQNDAFKRGGKALPYATLESVIDAIKEPLSENGIAYVQAPGEMTDGKLSITTVLMHGASGEWMRSTLTIPVVASTPQAVGSAITYARRYSLMAMVGIAAEDDDGNAGSGRDEPVRKVAGMSPENWAVIANELTLQGKAIRNIEDLTSFWKSEPFTRFRSDAPPERVSAVTAILKDHGEALKAATLNKEQA
jgi:hypothetical protein